MSNVLKRALIVLLVLGVGIATAVALTYPRAGDWLYGTTMQLEARLAGLELHEVPVRDTTLTVYTNTLQDDRPTLVMLHGYSSNKEIWIRFARHFRKDYNLIIPDLAGHGASPFATGQGYSAPDQAGRVIDLLDHFDIEKVHVIGNSMGGFISAHVAHAYPERTLTATLIDPAGIESPEPSKLDMMRKAGRNPFLIDSQEQFDEFYAMTMAKPPWVPRIVLVAMMEGYQARSSELDEIERDFFGNYTFDERLHEIRVPTLVLWGDQDDLIDVSAAPVWAEGVADGRLVIFHGIGHMPMFEIPKESAETLREFIETPDLHDARAR